MSRRYKGSVLSATAATTANSASGAKGVWTLDQQIQAQGASPVVWPPQIIQVDQVYTTPGTYTWVAPAGISSVSAVAIGPGGNGASGSAQYISGYFYCCYFNRCEFEQYTIYRGGPGGGGGGLSYRNSMPVTAGNSYTVVVGSGGSGTASYVNLGSSPSFLCYCSARASAGQNGTYAGYCGGPGGAPLGSNNGGANGGRGGNTTALYSTCYFYGGGGGGGAAGYQNYYGNGGNGGYSSYYGSTGCQAGYNYSYVGGGGGGGGGQRTGGAGGGGTGLYGTSIVGTGAGGTGGFCGSNARAFGGGPGSGGGNTGSQSFSNYNVGGGGGLYGGGGGGGAPYYGSGGYGGSGAVRIIGPATTRTFPNAAQA